jgi:hypothetical protein
MRRLWPIGIVVAVTGCGAEHVGPPDPRCTNPAAIEQVAGGGRGPRISDCVRRAIKDSDLQNVGFAVSRAADDLGAGSDAHALGFLIGAVRRGTGASGVQAELVNRVEAVARHMAGRSAAVEQGIADGEARG